MSDESDAYPPPEPEGTQPRMPEPGIPDDPIVGNKMGSQQDEDKARDAPDAPASGDQQP